MKLLLASMGFILATGVAAAAPPWTPEQWVEVETLDLCTTGAEEGTYCFPVWLVVLEGDVYVRLGSKASDRVRANTGGMVLPVEIGGERFEHVSLVEAPEQVDAVARAMADKYWSDIFIRFLSHPMTLRLRPQEAAVAQPQEVVP